MNTPRTPLLRPAAAATAFAIKKRRNWKSRCTACTLPSSACARLFVNDLITAVSYACAQHVAPRPRSFYYLSIKLATLWRSVVKKVSCHLSSNSFGFYMSSAGSILLKGDKIFLNILDWILQLLVLQFYYWYPSHCTISKIILYLSTFMNLYIKENFKFNIRFVVFKCIYTCIYN